MSSTKVLTSGTGLPSLHLFSGKAFTLLELMVVIGLIAILAALAVGAQGKIRERSERVRCMTNMRSIHAGLSSYVQLKGHWPQIPNGLDLDAKDEWLLEEMKTVGLPMEIWKCPTLARLQASGEEDSEPTLLDYGITEFDDNQFTPFKWGGQPWLAEAGDNHGDGALVLFPDGSIRTMTEVLARPGN